MNRAEVTKLCRYIKAACPAQAVDQHTPAVWHEIMPGDYTLDECRAAVGAIIGRGERFVDLGTVITEVKRARPAPPPPGQLDIKTITDPAAYLQARADQDAADAAVLTRLRMRAGVRGEMFTLPSSTTAPTGVS